jgi:hypothetical protein
MLLTTSGCLAQVPAEPALRIVRSFTHHGDRTPLPEATHQLSLNIAVMRGTGWRAEEEVIPAAQRAATFLAQCGIHTTAFEVTEVEGPRRFRSLYTPASRELAGRLALPKPTLFFVEDTLNQPAFDAEAVGRGNSRTRPEMANTVWIANGARDLPNVIAHELAHVLADSGDHSEDPGNLMREETALGDTRLTVNQCLEIKRNGASNGLLEPLK